MTRARGQAGFTLVEVLVSMTAGLAVLMAILAVMDRASVFATRTQDRVDATQRGRHALEDIVAQLRSGVCTTTVTTTPTETASVSNPPIRGGTGNTVSFHVMMGDENAIAQRRELIFDPTKRTIVEKMWQGTPPAGWDGRGNPTNVNFGAVNATPTRTRTLLDNVVADGATPVFRFMGFNGSMPASVDPTPLAVPLVEVDMKRVIQIDVTFRVRPRKAAANSNLDSIFAGSAYLRTADPLDPAQGPRCA